ncbi:hypothetical protein [Natronosalvus amylolyticus]|uniref:hypothetical protein n=1 Tax=Natronosalvus amylolyticus TaxID=2961994 RepID=UPI0020C98040|nr:hypothetical protein [Natronosalvus amylolyticus]
MEYDTHGNKSGCTGSEKPAVVLLKGGTLINVVHQFVNTDDQLCIYLVEQGDRIDAKINLDEIKAVIKTRRGAHALEIDDSTDIEGIA